MSFSATKNQIKNGKKTVTRRMGWNFLSPGDIIMACEKCQGLKKGEKIKKIRPLQIIKIESEYLFQITKSDVAKEGFQGMTSVEFINMFCKMNGCHFHTRINRIEFKYA